MLEQLREDITTSLGKLFGLEVQTSSNSHSEKEKSIDSPVRNIKTDGAVEIVSASGGIFYQGYDNVLASLKSERELVLQFRKMSTCPEIRNAIEEIVNDAIVYSKNEKYPVKLDLNDVEMSKAIKDKILECFEYILSLLHFDKEAHILFRKWYIDGRLPFYILPFDKAEKLYANKVKKNIKNLIYIDPLDIKKIRELEMAPSKTDKNVEVIKKINEMYIYFASPKMQNNFIGQAVSQIFINGQSYQGIKFTPDSIVYSTSGYQDDKGNVLSYLYDAIKVANQLESLEESMIIYRVSRAPSRRVFYVDVGNLPTSKAEQYLNSLIGKYKHKVSYDSSKGKVSSDAVQKAMLEDYWLPRREGGKGTEIDTISGSDSFNSVPDELQYFKHKLYAALYVPVSRLETETMFTFARTGEITRNEVKFSKFITHLRKRFSHELFDKLLKLECVMDKICTEKEWNDVIQPNLQYIFEEDSYFAELKNMDMLRSRLELLGTITDFVPTYFSQEFVKRNVLFQTDEEIKELEKQREKEKKEAQEDGEIYNDVSGDKLMQAKMQGMELGDTGLPEPPAIPPEQMQQEPEEQEPENKNNNGEDEEEPETLMQKYTKIQKKTAK